MYYPTNDECKNDSVKANSSLKLQSDKSKYHQDSTDPTISATFFEHPKQEVAMNNASSKSGSELEPIDITEIYVDANDTESSVEFRMPKFSEKRPIVREWPARSYPGAGRIVPELRDQVLLEPLNLCEIGSLRTSISLRF